jgi:hypothetical protein
MQSLCNVNGGYAPFNQNPLSEQCQTVAVTQLGCKLRTNQNLYFNETPVCRSPGNAIN